MKKISSLLGLVILLSTLLALPSFVQAQVPTNDAVEGGSKISRWAANMSEQCQKAMDWVANSKVGKFVGDGVKAAKDGIKFAQNAYKAGMAIYGAAMDSIDDVKNSKEYQSAMLAKDIAMLSKDLKNVAEQRLKSQDDYDKRVDNIKQVANAKIQNLQNNIPITKAYYEQQGSSKNVDDEMNAKLSENQGQLDAITRQMEASIQKEKLNMIGVNDDLETQIEIKTKKIAKLTKRLAELNDVDIKIENPLDALNATKDELFLKVGEIASIRNKQSMKQQLYEKRREVIYKTYEKALQSKLQLQSKREEVEGIADLIETMSGTSDASGITSEVLVKQANFLNLYIEFVVADLKREITTEAAAVLTPQSRSVDKKGKLNLDNYKYSPPKESLLSKIKKTANNAVSTVKGGVAKVNKVKDDVQSKIDDVNEMKDGATDMLDAAAALKENPSALQGMM